MSENSSWLAKAFRRRTEAEEANECVSKAINKIEILSNNCKTGNYCNRLAVPKERYDELLANGQVLMEDLKRFATVGGPLVADIAALCVNQNWTNLNAIYRLITKHLRNIPEIVNAVVALSKSIFNVLCTLKAIAVPILQNLISSVMNRINLWLRRTPEVTGDAESSYICCGVRDVRRQIKWTADDLTKKAKEFETKNKRDTALIYVRGSIKIREFDGKVNVEQCQCFTENNVTE